MSRQRHAYTFGDLPLSPVAPGTNVLVTGPALGGIRELVLRLIRPQSHGEGVLFIAADAGGTESLIQSDLFSNGLDPAHIGVVDCTRDGHDDATRNVHAVGTPNDLTGVGIEYSSLYEQLSGDGARHVRTGIYTLAPFVMYVDARAIYRFVHTLTGRIRSADGLGVCAIDPDTLDDRMLSSLSQAFDGRIRLRTDGDDSQLSVEGLPDQPEGWQSVDSPQ